MDRNDLLGATRAEFLRQFQDSAEQSIFSSIQDIYKNADPNAASGSRAKLALHARLTLQGRSRDLLESMHSNMETLLDRSFHTIYNSFRPSFSAAASADTLSLIDASAYEDEMRIRDITKCFRHRAEEQLRDLNMRIAMLFEQDHIKERENPFRPYLFARCIANAVQSLRETSEVSAYLADQLADQMTGHIGAIYDRVNAHLEAQGITKHMPLKIQKSQGMGRDYMLDRPALNKGPERAQGYFIGAPDFHPSVAVAAAPPSLAPAAPAPARKVERLFDAVLDMAASAPSAPGGTEPGPPLTKGGPGAKAEARVAGWLGEGEVLGGALRNIFAGGGLATQTTAAPDSELSDILARQAWALGPQADAGAPDPASAAQVPHSTGESRNLVLAYRAGLELRPPGAHEQMTVDLVAMLFEFILRDSQVPPAIRAQLGRLQFLVLKVALADSSLLVNQRHPARKLINRIGTLALGFQQVDPGGRRVTHAVSRIVDALLADSGNPALFSSLLSDLEAYVARELRAKDPNMARLVQVVEQAQKRAALRPDGALLMRNALAGLTMDPYLQNFLETPWVQAIDMAERADVQRATQFRLLVPDLLWSSVPKARAEDRSQLFALLPTILNTLREGLTVLGWDPARQQTFLNWLVDVHTNALRAVTEPGATPSLSAMHRHFQNFTGTAQALDNPVFDGQQFHAEALRNLDFEVDVLDQIFAQADQAQGAVVRADGPPALRPALALRLESGAAIGMQMGAKVRLGLLLWFSPNTASILLRLDQSATPSIISAALFQRLLTNGRLRFLEQAPLFERAVQSLLKSADQTDGARAS